MTNAPATRTARHFAEGTRVTHAEYGAGTITGATVGNMFPVFDNGTIGTQSTRVAPLTESTPSAKEADMTTIAATKNETADRIRGARKARTAKASPVPATIAKTSLTHSTVADIAAMCDTTPRAIRAFLRSTDQGTGKGSTYKFTAAQAKRIVKAYNAR